MVVLLQPYLGIDLTGLVQFGKNMRYILPPLVSQNYLQQSISVKLIYQFLYIINGYLFFICLEKVFEKERKENKKGNFRGVTVKKDRKLKDWNDGIIGFDLVFVGQDNADLNFIFCYYRLFSKMEFSGIQLSYMKL